jgi:hypothetical protein
MQELEKTMLESELRLIESILNLNLRDLVND